MNDKRTAMTSAARKLPAFMDVAEFIVWPGDGTGTRYELVDGVLRAMAPASDAHNTIVTRLAVILDGSVRQNWPGCRVVTSPGTQPRITADWNFRIPDIGVTCAPNVSGAVMTPDPILLVEVLSPGNAADTRENVRAYATLPSVTEILVVHATRIRAELLRRDAKGDWPMGPVMVEAGSRVELESLGAGFLLDEAYAGTHLVG